MKKSFSFGIFLWGILYFSLSAQPHEQVLERIKSAFLEGNAKNLSVYFDKNIEIMLDGHKADYSQVQSVFILKDFFEENPPKSFEYIHQDSFKKGHNYLRGTYQSKMYRFQVNILVKSINQNTLITSLEIYKN